MESRIFVNKSFFPKLSIIDEKVVAILVIASTAGKQTAVFLAFRNDEKNICNPVLAGLDSWPPTLAGGCAMKGT